MSPLVTVKKITNKLSGVKKPDSFDTITKYTPSSIFPNKKVQEWANKGIYKTNSTIGEVNLNKDKEKHFKSGFVVLDDEEYSIELDNFSKKNGFGVRITTVGVKSKESQIKGQKSSLGLKGASNKIE